MKNVFEKYNLIADWFAAHRYQGLIEKGYLDKLIKHVGKNAAILDLGCGTGMPIMDYLTNQGMHVTGVDASYRMLEIAKKHRPSAEFIQSDMRSLSLDRKFDAIVAWHSFFHLPAEDQPSMFQIFEDHLEDHGVLIFTSGTAHGVSWGENGGELLFHASLDPNQYESLLEEHHFHVLEHIIDDPECGEATVWMAQLHQTPS
ncbi:class I SAM-dependent DNA methyltransferase [Chitinophaga agri]|uniref:Class I SAM-dependent methyltransferase n=1 Tax=Chitinophaga agri TaxID=2703787 RepID=A0A6B9ZMB3_9BACT|nr:class I SAM-dependent methyltransferase [Chitinophaga agri]QHS62584.1 class I SAM-dependent methyltransferase [Chitinophaga agri]